MRIIIIGAGQLGTMLAKKLATLENDVVVMDSELDSVESLRDKVDVMTFSGNGINAHCLKDVEVKGATVVAVTGNQSINILACQIAKQLGAAMTICRLFETDFFSSEDNITPQFFGIDKAFSSPAECTQHVVDILSYEPMLEKVHFSNYAAVVAMMKLPGDSPICESKLQDFASHHIIANIRIAAIIRQNRLMWPHGTTQLQQDDLIYVAGGEEQVKAFSSFIMGKHESVHKIVVIAGANTQGVLIAQRAISGGMEVRIIDESRERCDSIIEKLPSGTQVLAGKSTVEDILLEAGVNECDVFISALDDDEDGILSCMLAKHLGAKKVIPITHKVEYSSLVPVMNNIDSTFNSTVVSANTVLRLLEQRGARIDLLLKSYSGYFHEFKIEATSCLNGKSIKESKLPKGVVIALIFRKQDVIVPTGPTVMQYNDTLLAIVNRETEEQLMGVIS